MKPIAEHNAEMAAHMQCWFSADPGKTPRAFYYDAPRDCWLALRRTIPERPGFLNFDGKIEVISESDGTTKLLKRRDMTDAEFDALPIAEPHQEAA